MAWVRLDDGFDQHPKIWAAGGVNAIALIVRALCWCNRNVTDGFLPISIMPLLMVGIEDQGLPVKLVEAGIWERRDESGYWIHDFLVYNRSKKQVEAGRRESKKRMKEYRARSRQVTAPLQRNLLEVHDSPSPVSSGGSRSASASTQKESFTLQGQVSFTVPPSILEALGKCAILGQPPALRSPRFWRAMIRAHQGIDFAEQILLAEAFLTTHPGYERYTQFLGNWFEKAARRAKEA